MGEGKAWSVASAWADIWSQRCIANQGRNRHIFLRGQSHFSWYFSQREMFFPGKKIPIVVDPKQISVVFKSEEQKGKKKKKKKWSSPLFSYFLLTSYFRFQFSTFPFTIFLLFFSIFTLFPFFPDMSAKISRSEVSGGHSAPCPPACYATVANPLICPDWDHIACECPFRIVLH